MRELLERPTSFAATREARACDYDVVRTRPEDVRTDIERIWRENLAHAVKPEDRFTWLYRDAPDPAGTVFVLRARMGGVERIVGTNGLMVRRLQIVPGREARAAVGGDLAVDAEHRCLSPAMRLMRAVGDFVASDFDVGYAFPNAKAAAATLRHARMLGKTTRWARVLRHASYRTKVVERLRLSPPVGRVLASEHVAGTLGPVVDVARLALGAPAIAQAHTRYRLEWSKTFGADLDDLWREARHDYDIVGVRTSDFLAWRYPGREIATLVRREDCATAAYAILEWEAATGAAHLRDVFGKKEALAPLIDLLVPALWRREAASVSVSFLGASYFAEILRARGFEPRAERRTVIVQVGTKMSSEREYLENPGRWHLFDVDEDA